MNRALFILIVLFAAFQPGSAFALNSVVLTNFVPIPEPSTYALLGLAAATPVMTTVVAASLRERECELLNAGIGLYGSVIDLPLERQLAMIELNVSSVVALTKLFAGEMVKRGSGTIMNVASLLSFLPFPYYSVYSATKTFVLAFSETMAAELEGTGVNIVTLCPGPVDTNFTTDSMLSTNAYKANRPVSPEFVASEGVKLLLKGSGKKIVGFNNWFISNLPRITPDRLMIRIKKHLASQRAS